MLVPLNTEPLRTLDDVRAFLEGNLAVEFKALPDLISANGLHRFSFRPPTVVCYSPSCALSPACRARNGQHRPR